MAAIRSRRNENEAMAKAVGHEVVLHLVQLLNDGGVKVERSPVDEGGDEVFG